MTPLAVFKVERPNAARINEVTSDDIVSRLSIVTRDSETLGVAGDCIYVLMEGRADGVDRAKLLFEDKQIGRAVPQKVAEEVKAAITAEEEAAATGMGTIFDL